MKRSPWYRYRLCFVFVVIGVACSSRQVYAGPIQPGTPEYEVLKLVRSQQQLLQQLETDCERMEELSVLTAGISSMADQLLPHLERIQESTALKAIGALPFCQNPVAAVRDSAAALALVLETIKWLHHLDTSYQAPLRKAILQSNQLLKSKDSNDVPPLLDSYRDACRVLLQIEEKIGKSREQIERTVTLLETTGIILGYLTEGNQTRQVLDRINNDLKKLQYGLDALNISVRESRRFMESVLAAGEGTQRENLPESGEARGKESEIKAEHNNNQEKRDKETENVNEITEETENKAQTGTGVTAEAQTTSLSANKGQQISVLTLLLVLLPGLVGLTALLWFGSHYLRHRHKQSLFDSTPLSPASPSIPTAMATLYLGRRRIMIAGDKVVVIGRSAGAQSIQLDDDSISARHADIRYTGQYWVLTDLESTNGTFVNEKQISQSLLQSGDKVRFGKVSMSFSIIRESPKS